MHHFALTGVLFAIITLCTLAQAADPREVRLFPGDRSEQFRVVLSLGEDAAAGRQIVKLELRKNDRWILVHEYQRSFLAGPVDYARPVLLMSKESGILCFSNSSGLLDFQLVKLVKIQEKSSSEWRREMVEAYEHYNNTMSNRSTVPAPAAETGPWPGHRLQSDGIRKVLDKLPAYGLEKYAATSNLTDAVWHDGQLTSIEIAVQFCDSQSADVESTHGIVIYTRDHNDRWSISNVRISDAPHKTDAEKSKR